MATADYKANGILHDILTNGVSDEGKSVRPRWRDGAPAHAQKIPRTYLSFQPHELPLLTQKKVAWKTAIKEMLWIWQKKSNNVQVLRDMGVNIWDDWERADGTIGKAYGYQLAKREKKVAESPRLYEMWDSLQIDKIQQTQDKGIVKLDQVDHLLYQLQNNPQSNRLLTSLWNWDDLDDMSLSPCVYETQSLVLNDELHFMVSVRSNDMALGFPFNIFQYGVLHRMLAQVTGYKLGTLSFDIRAPHVYLRHIEGIKEQMAQTIYEAPVLQLNPKVQSFYEFTIDDFTLENYTHGGKRSFEIAI